MKGNFWYTLYLISLSTSLSPDGVSCGDIASEPEDEGFYNEDFSCFKWFIGKKYNFNCTATVSNITTSKPDYVQNLMSKKSNSMCELCEFCFDETFPNKLIRGNKYKVDASVSLENRTINKNLTPLTFVFQPPPNVTLVKFTYNITYGSAKFLINRSDTGDKNFNNSYCFLEICPAVTSKSECFTYQLETKVKLETNVQGRSDKRLRNLFINCSTPSFTTYCLNLYQRNKTLGKLWSSKLSPSPNDYLLGNSSWICREDTSKALLVTSILSVLSLVFVGVCAYIIFHHIRSKKIFTSTCSYSRSRRNTYETELYGSAYTDMTSPLMSLLERYSDELQGLMVDYQSLKLHDAIGEGEFGIVYKGSLVIGDTEESVAVKTMKSNDNSFSEKEGFIQESVKMKGLHHKNVMHLIGVCLNRSPSSFQPHVILPYLPNGDLNSYLLNMRVTNCTHNFNVRKLLKFALDVSNGMLYLSSKSIVHRDLAARNCMLTEDFTVVISDFGLSRSMYTKDYYRQTHSAKVPFKWMAHECLSDHLFSSKSDVWAFGVTLWEIFTFSQHPYPGVANHEIFDFLMKGNRLSRPPLCPRNVWSEAIYCCWQPLAGDRPDFESLIRILEKFYNSIDEDFDSPIDVNKGFATPNNVYEEPIVFPQGVGAYNMAE